MAVSGLGVAYSAAGFVLLWSGVKNTTLKDTLTSFLRGQAPQASPTGALQIGISTGTDQASSGAAGGDSAAAAAATGALTAITGGGGTPAANKALGALLAAGYGWGPGSTDWPYLESGWQEESGWSQTAANDPSDPYDHAYGIPQANPGSKMASAGPDWKTNPATQIRWGLGYIKSTFGRPSQVPGWTPDGPAAGYTGY